MNREAYETLMSFMAAMSVWEIEFCSAQDEADEPGSDIGIIRDRYAAKLLAIFDQYSIHHGVNRNRLVDLGSTLPPTYDPERDHVEVEKENEPVFLVKQSAGFKSHFRFTMFRHNETWLIKEKQRLDENGHWAPSAL
ncbi:NTF2 fold immunity protein [Pseudomonas sp. KNUC1026]|uniref:NTF2 fold immunity protein n=1 Tax=Pseudomonas sp. KNUC1026 TaxID=2893890 RepID=UPI001F428FE8|nr:NTF2 fold immunity protein [Pseudomonas sp. KNUC1026]UFH49886.1 RhsIA family immunity protein [Pseudomonas sp. KNUC1026]